MKRQITNRSDIELLVGRFYDKVRQDELIGDIFNNAIDDWPAHLKTLSYFWETNLLFVSQYKGNPPRVHAEVDKQTNHTIDQKHFDRWILHWNNTLDEHFEGELAAMAKQRAKNIAGVLLSKIVAFRPDA
tara:strand:- start:1035 stop:1424 length:390 start_codon:yes stop_codon:yes gene_type:complete